MSGRRALHFVFKVGDRTETIRFFKSVLGMKVFSLLFRVISVPFAPLPVDSVVMDRVCIFLSSSFAVC